MSLTWKTFYTRWRHNHPALKLLLLLLLLFQKRLPACHLQNHREHSETPLHSSLFPEMLFSNPLYVLIEKLYDQIISFSCGQAPSGEIIELRHIWVNNENYGNFRVTQNIIIQGSKLHWAVNFYLLEKSQFHA
jgi:hypothetical protein